MQNLEDAQARYAEAQKAMEAAIEKLGDALVQARLQELRRSWYNVAEELRKIAREET